MRVRAVLVGTVAAALVAPEDDHSTTNVQERGVDEPDTVETDGRRLLTVSEAGVTSSRLATLGVAWLPFQEGAP